MDTSAHTMNTLFQQLGLPNDDAAIDSFVGAHSLEPGICLSEAGFWSPSQAAFLKEAIDDDSDWAEVVDHLDAQLRAG